MTADNTQDTELLSFTFKGEGDDVIHAKKWLPVNTDIRAVLIINHGMAEHVGRYDSFSRYMAGHGFAVYGEDHRGHGMTAGCEEHLGYFAESEGWMKVLGDIRSLHLLVMEEQKGLPVFMLGHSMGSFLTRHYISLYGSELKGVVISGTGNQNPVLLKIARFLSGMEILFKGSRHRSRLLDTLSFGSYNKPFKQEAETGFEWLSSDKTEVRKYADDPYCGFICSCGFYRDLTEGLSIISQKRCFCSTAENLPILIISGKEDPVGENGKGVKIVASQYEECGVRDLTFILKDKMRHECLNEVNREECYIHISEWLTTRLTG